MNSRDRWRARLYLMRRLEDDLKRARYFDTADGLSSREDVANRDTIAKVERCLKDAIDEIETRTGLSVPPAQELADQDEPPTSEARNHSQAVRAACAARRLSEET